jgi:transposase-like protein
MAIASNGMPKRRRTRHNTEYPAEVLALAERIVKAMVAGELGVHAKQVYAPSAYA